MIYAKLNRRKFGLHCRLRTKNPMSRRTTLPQAALALVIALFLLLFLVVPVFTVTAIGAVCVVGFPPLSTVAVMVIVPLLWARLRISFPGATS